MPKTTKSNRAFIQLELERADNQISQWAIKHVEAAGSIFTDYINAANEQGQEPTPEHVYIANQLANISKSLQMIAEVLNELRKMV